jgi:hypothetical protein
MADFTSLLQEPEAKWRPVADFRGVAIHQLNSIDKTLVVFRAEAVFVGVGIWDLFATIASPGGRRVWDKTHEESTLLEDVNELTDLSHFRSKAAWPVSARDSVMLRTTYKSPSSVHLFGFSVDNTDLFPRIPPSIDPTVIRTQIDLQGWSIDSLSPNTTQVTLLEQSDPRGWSNKSSIPQVMMTTLAGIGEFAINHGAPPIATRLGGAKALASRYEVDKETYRFEYESAEARRSLSSSTVTAFPLPVAIRAGDRRNSETSLKSLNASPRLVSNIECEVRCDVDAWANHLVIVIDPPHSSISALKRNRLSSGGGGLWLTIEHDPVTLGAEKVIITIRRGTRVPDAKPAVVVNGSKIRVDIEDLAEADVKLLKKQKRARPSRAPLDQPPALGTLRQRQSSMHIATVPSTQNSDPYKTITPASAYNRIALPLSRFYSVAAQTTRATIVPMLSPTHTASAVSSPVDAAVRALTQLARMHADRDGESTDPFGWQPVSDRDGLKIERRIVSHVSETFPIFRAGRIIEGFTAEEVSAAVASLRKDDNFDKPLRLQSFGYGITTSHLTAHTSFPFRGRSMLVATVIARMPDLPTSSPSVGPPAALSTILHASTSSFDPKTIEMDQAEYNPLALPGGSAILEGWILETIDPYSHEYYAIPSTRCMYVAAVDYSGSIPLSVNNMLNGSLPRSLLAVETMLRTNGPPSRARLPSMSVLSPDSAAQGPWSLEGIDAERTGVDQRNDANEYCMTVTIQPNAAQSSKDDTLHPILKHTDSRSSVQSSRSTVIDLAEDICRGHKDLVVLEVDVGSALIKAGCEVQLKAASLPAALHSTNSDVSTLSFKLLEATLGLPFKCSVIALAPSVLQSASLDPASQARHLLRVTLPTSGYEAPVADPLTGKTAPLPRPRWLLDLINDGAVVQLRLTVKRKGPAAYTFGGVDLPIEDERKTARKDSRDPARSKLPQLVK